MIYPFFLCSKDSLALKKKKNQEITLNTSFELETRNEFISWDWDMLVYLQDWIL